MATRGSRSERSLSRQKERRQCPKCTAHSRPKAGRVGAQRARWWPAAHPEMTRVQALGSRGRDGKKTRRGPVWPLLVGETPAAGGLAPGARQGFGSVPEQSVPKSLCRNEEVARSVRTVARQDRGPTLSKPECQWKRKRGRPARGTEARFPGPGGQLLRPDGWQVEAQAGERARVQRNGP